MGSSAAALLTDRPGLAIETVARVTVTEEVECTHSILIHSDLGIWSCQFMLRVLFRVYQLKDGVVFLPTIK